MNATIKSFILAVNPSMPADPGLMALSSFLLEIKNSKELFSRLNRLRGISIAGGIIPMYSLMMETSTRTSGTLS